MAEETGGGSGFPPKNPNIGFKFVVWQMRCAVFPAWICFLALLQSCGDHDDEIRECEQCDTLSNLVISFERFNIADGDTLEIAIAKPGVGTTYIVQDMYYNQDFYTLSQVIDTTCTLVVSVNNYSHEYSNIHKEWIYMPNKFDHTDGKCGWIGYLLDGEVIVNESTMLQFK